MQYLSVWDWLVVAVSLLLTLGAAWYARQQQANAGKVEAVAGRSLGAWVLALSAGAAANSGFTLTAAVAMGYLGGLKWLLFFAGYFIGDIIFWFFLAHKVNALSRKQNTVTLPEFLTANAGGKWSPLLGKISTLVLVVLLTSYVAGQWLAAGKMGGEILGVNPLDVAALFALFVVGYTAISGFRGAVYTDFVQAMFMIALALAVAVLAGFAWMHIPPLSSFTHLPEGFLSLTGTLPWWQVVLMPIGGAALILGFHLGQPQMMTRWMAGKSSGEVIKARWIFIIFNELTCTLYVAFGVVLRLIAGDLPDPEQGLAWFTSTHGFPGMTGLLITGAIATIASTAGALVAVCAEMVRHDLAPYRWLMGKSGMLLLAPLVGLASVLWLTGDKSVFDMVLLSVGLIGAALAPTVLSSVLGWRVSAGHCLVSMVVGLGVAIGWPYLDIDQTVGIDVLVGMAAGLATLFLLKR